jgi:predicted transcriptional regulator
MRTHISVPDDLIQEIDKLAGRRKRSAFIEEAIRVKLINERQKAAFDKSGGPLDPEKYPHWRTSEAVSAWVSARRKEDQELRDRDLPKIKRTTKRPA